MQKFQLLCKMNLLFENRGAQKLKEANEIIIIKELKTLLLYGGEVVGVEREMKN